MRCPACDSADLREFFDGGAVPVFCNVLHETADAARSAPRAEVVLGFCDACALVFNTAFRPELVEYAEGYENSLHGSPRFHAFAQELARGLVERHGLQGKSVAEIGGGRGEFMDLLLEAGAAHGAVFDPSVPAGAEAGRAFEVKREYFAPEHLEQDYALIATRHVIEHVPTPRTFVHTIAASLRRRPGTALYLELPNGLWTFRDLGIWDIIYEHCSYMAPCTVRRLLHEEGLDSFEVQETFGGQFLSAETNATARPFDQAGHAAEVAAASTCVDAFADHHARELARWSERLSAHSAAGRRVAVWGAGSKGVTFLNSVAGAEAVEWVVDVNSLKSGLHVAGSAQQITLPEALRGEQVDEVIVMNPLYLDEIGEMLRALGVRASVVPVS